MRKLAYLILAAAFYGGCGKNEPPPESTDNADDTAAAQAVPAIAPGATMEVELEEKGLKMSFVWVPGGTFRMGTDENEPGRDTCENEHLVTLSSGFWIGRTEVTQGEFYTILHQKPSTFKGSKLPVQNVSYEDALVFIGIANKRPAVKAAGIKLRLPTEAEWEYAARGGPGSSRQPYAGASDIDTVAWWALNSGERRVRGTKITPQRLQDAACKPHPVAQKEPNALGIYDMCGNVREWCSDLFEDYPPREATDPTGAKTGDQRIVRGGSWRDRKEDCRVGARAWTGSCATDFIGFRVVADIVE